MVSESRAVLFEIVSVMERFVESVTAMDALEMLRSAVEGMLGVTAVLNSKPAGVRRTRVTLVPCAKSPFAPSVMVIAPIVVHAGVTAFAALSAEIAPPPEAPVNVTAANALFHPAVARANNSMKA